MWSIPLFDLDYTEQERSAVNEVLKSGWLTIGEKTQEFENNFAEYLGENVLASAVSSGTASFYTWH